MRQLHFLGLRAMTALLTTAAVVCSYNLSHAQSPKTSNVYQLSEAPTGIPSQLPKNLTRWHMGATLVLIKEGKFQRIPVSEVSNFDQSVFLSDNSALSYNITQGQHDFVIDLGQSVRVSRFFLNNQSAAGTFKLLASDTLEDLESQAWIKLSHAVAFEKGVIPSITFPEVEIRYILLRFDIDAAGTIGNFGATGGSR